MRNSIKSIKKKALPVLLTMAVLLSSLTGLMASAAQISVLDGKTNAQISSFLESHIIGAMDACYDNIGAAGGTILGSDYFTGGASSTATDWMAFDIGRFGTVDANGRPSFLYSDTGAQDYLDAMQANMESRYLSGSGKLDNSKSTEWHRAIIAISALGGDATNFGTDPRNNNPIDLVADGTYSNVLGNTMAAGPARQGINGPIFSLISKNTLDYSNPQNKPVKFTDEELIQYILERQLADGENGAYSGWALSGSVSDPDITAMAMQALGSYYHDDTVYTYTNVATKKQISKTVRQAVNEAIAKLSAIQRADGDFSSWGTVNVESTAQVMVALTMLGIDPKTDERFIKNGNTLIDGILKYWLPATGGFTHSYTLDPENPTADPGNYNGMANDQATYGLIAYWRFVNGMRNLYDYRPDFTPAERADLDTVITTIDSALAHNGQAGYKAALQQALADYRALPADKKLYIVNYTALWDAIHNVGGEDVLGEEATIIAIEVTAPPVKTIYRAMDQFDPSGMVVSLVYDDGNRTVLDPAKYTYAPGHAQDDPLLMHHTAITIKHFGLSVQLPVTVLATWDGTGTEQDPYLIRTPQNLNALRILVNDFATTFEGQYFSLTNSIDLAEFENWIPISLSTTSAAQFKGSFDGQGYAIQNLTIDKTTTYSGLFGTLSDGAAVQNIVLQSGQIKGAANTGALAGASWGAAITNITNYIPVTGTGNQTGGIIGGIPNAGSGVNAPTENTVLKNCVNYGAVVNESTSSSAMNIGGIMGYSVKAAVIYDCRNHGAVTLSASTASSMAGGIIGNAGGRNVRVIGCSNTGNITNNTTGASGATGGISGNVLGGTATTASTPGIIESCYNTGLVYGRQLVGGVVGSLGNYNNMKNCYSVGTVTATAASNQRVGALAGSIGTTSMQVSDNYYLSGMTAAGAGGVSSMYTAKTVAELKSAGTVALLNGYTGTSGYPVSWAEDTAPQINGGYPVYTTQKAAVIAGDIDNDGTVGAADVVLIRKIILGLYAPTFAQESAADLNGNGDVGITDLILIKKMIANA